MSLIGGRYNVVKFLGKGGFGVVEACTDNQQGNSYVAIKTIPSKCVNQESKRLLREIDIMIKLANKHPHLMSVLDVLVTPASAENTDDGNAASDAEVTPDSDFNVHIVMPMMKGDLHQFSRRIQSQQKPFNDPEFCSTVVVVFAFQVVFGLDYLHKCGIVHRDLKPDNVLVRLDAANPYASSCLIADFGLARDVAATDTFYICTRHYRPPEVVTNTSHGETSIDIWSLGCIFYELCTGKTLFCLPSALNAQGQWEGAKASQQLEVILNIVGLPSKEDIQQYMQPGNVQSYLLKSRPRPSLLRDMLRRNWRLAGACEEEIQLWIDLICRCLEFYPQKRATAEELCRHSLFKRFDVHFGENVTQFPLAQYDPAPISSSGGTHAIRENKEVILEAMRRLHEAIPKESESPQREEEESDKVRPGAPLKRHHFPSVRDQTLSRKYSSLPVNSATEVQEAISEVLSDLELFTHDTETSAELRALLNYFVGINTMGDDNHDDGVEEETGDGPHVHEDDDDEW